MTEQTSRQSAAALAHRLRLLQAEMRDLTPEARAGLLREQIEVAVAGLGSGRGPAFLRQLEAHFADWSSLAVEGPEAVPAPAAPSPVAAPAPAASPAEQFLDLPPETQAAAVLDLQARGLLPRSGGRAVAPGREGDTELRVALCGFVGTVVPFFLRTLASLGVSADGLVDQALVSRLEALAAGEAAALGTAELRAEVEQLGACLCSLLSVIPTLGKHCTQALAEQLSAERIEDLARNQGKGVMERWEAVYWRKYREVSKAFSDGVLEKDVNQKVAAHVDKWLQRARQHPPAKKGRPT